MRLRLAALFLLLPVLGSAQPNFKLTGVDGGAILHDISCSNRSGRPCYAILLNNASGPGADGRDVAFGRILLSGVWSLEEAQKDLLYVAVALGKAAKPGLEVQLATVQTAPADIPLSAWSHDPADGGAVRSARVVLSTSENGITQTFGLGSGS